MSSELEFAASRMTLAASRRADDDIHAREASVWAEEGKHALNHERWLWLASNYIVD
jgi:hypothetical protein